MTGKTEAGRVFQFLEVMGINVLANEVVWHYSNLTAKVCWESAKRELRPKNLLGGITDFNSSEHNAAIVSIIYKIMKARKHFFDEIASRGIR